MLNVIEAKNDLQMMSDQQLLKKAQQGDPNYPQFLIVAEKQNRDKTRAEVAKRQTSDQTVAEQIMYGGIQSQRPPQMAMMPPQMPAMPPQMPAMPPQAPMMPPQMAQAPQPPMQMMSDGGVVKLQAGTQQGLTPAVLPETLLSQKELAGINKLMGANSQDLGTFLDFVKRTYGDNSPQSAYANRLASDRVEASMIGADELVAGSREATIPAQRGSAPTNPYANAEGFMGLGYLARNAGEGVDKLSEYFKTFELPDINFTGIDTLYDYDADSAVVDRIQEKAKLPMQAQGLTDASVQGTGSQGSGGSGITSYFSDLANELGIGRGDEVRQQRIQQNLEARPLGTSRGFSGYTAPSGPYRTVASEFLPQTGFEVSPVVASNDGEVGTTSPRSIRDIRRRGPQRGNEDVTPDNKGSVAVGGSEPNLIQKFIEENDPDRVVRDAIEEGQGGQGNQSDNRGDKERRDNGGGLVSLPSDYKSMFDEIIGIKDDADFVKTPTVDFSGIRGDTKGLGIATILGSIGAGIAEGNLSKGIREATGAVDRLGKRLGDIGMAEKMSEQKAQITDITRQEGRLDKLRGYGLQIRKLIEDATNARISLTSAQVRSIPQMINNLLDFSDSVSMSERQQQGMRDAVAGLMADYQSLVSGQVDPRFKRVR